VLLQHGGYSTLGINTCIMVVPALIAWQAFAILERVPWRREPWFRASLVTGSSLLWLLTLVYGVSLLVSNYGSDLSYPDPDMANEITFHPLTLAGALLLSMGAAWLERSWQTAPDFALGLLLGELAVLVTVVLNCLVLLLGGEDDWQTLALLVFVAHLP